MKEMPGAETPWTSVNQLLAPDERFCISDGKTEKFLLAPRHSSQIAALLYLLRQEKVNVSGGSRVDSESKVILTPRAFSHLSWHDNGVVEVGGGCQFSTLSSFLFAKGYETGVKPPPTSSLKGTVVEALIKGKVGGYCTHGESPFEKVTGCELVGWDGSQLRWGAPLRSGPPGPSLHKQIGFERELPGVVTKIFLKCNPIPERRLSLSWSFRSERELWRQFELLKQFSSSWEVLDVVLSGDLSTTSFLFAQIAGQLEEMEIVAKECPGFLLASENGARGKIEKFFQQEGLQVSEVSEDHKIKKGEYLWIQKLLSKAWGFT